MDGEVFCIDNSELASFEAENKGYRGDIYVRLFNDKIYKLNVYDITRFKQDFEVEFQEYGFYSIEPNLIIVNEVTKSEIIKTIEGLYRQKYFDDIKPIDSTDVQQLSLKRFEENSNT